MTTDCYLVFSQIVCKDTRIVTKSQEDTVYMYRTSVSGKESRNTASIFTVKNLVSVIGDGITEDDVRDAFSAAGPVKELWMSQDAPHFGFIVYETQDEAENAISTLNGR